MESEHFEIFNISGGSFASPLGRLHSQKTHPQKETFTDRVAALLPGVRTLEKTLKWCRLLATHRSGGVRMLYFNCAPVGRMRLEKAI